MTTLSHPLHPDDAAALAGLADGWSQCGLESDAVAALAFGYAIPLIRINGDWIRRSREGERVVAQMKERIEG